MFLTNVQGVPKRKLNKELLITCRVSIVIIHLAYHLKGEHIKILLVNQSFDMASISVAEIVKTQFCVLPNFSKSFRSYSSTHISNSSFQIFQRRQRLCIYLSFDVSPQEKVTGGQVSRSRGPVYRALPPNPVIVAFSVQISMY